MWINKLCIELANNNEKTFLSTDWSGINKLICYFNGQNNDQIFNVFMSNRINLEETQKGIYFQIDWARSKTNGDTFDANMLLQQNGTSNGNTKSLEVDTNLQKIGTDIIMIFRVAKEEKQTENRLNQDFSQDDDFKKKESSSKSPR